jgi:hypothetical protein
MTGPWTKVSDAPSVDDWHEFLRAVEYEAERRGDGFDVWAALAEALTLWLDQYENAPRQVVRCADPLRAALDRLTTSVPGADIPGGSAVGAVLCAAIGAWTGSR